MNQIDILQYPSLINFLTSNSAIFKPLSNGQWIQTFCFSCDDATRSYKPNHGHFNIARYGNYCHCFRCDYSNSLSRLLISLGYNDHTILSILSKNNTQNFVYGNRNKLSNYADINIKEKIINYYDKFEQSNNYAFKSYLDYIDKRLGNIDPINFLMSPLINGDYLLVSMYNYNGALVTSRYITPHKKFRYLIPPSQIKPYYYFQDLNNIDTYINIVICEGAIDIVNISNYCKLFTNAFYIAIGGKQFKKILGELISNYLLIGNYNISIVLDNDNKNYQATKSTQDNKLWQFKKLINGCTDTVFRLNPSISISFYYPPISKDFSDLNYLEKL